MLYEFWIAYRVGGSIPVIFSYFTEFQPKEKRGMMISALATFWMFGNIIAAGKQSFLCPHIDRSGAYYFCSFCKFVCVQL